MGRPRVYANDAEREKAYRERMARIDLMITKELDQTLNEICDIHSVSKNALITAALKFALTNHDWKKDMPWRLTK